MKNKNVKIINKKKLLFLFSFLLCVVNFNVSYSEAAITSSQELVVGDGTTIELSVTVDYEELKYEYNTLTGVYTLELKEGNYPFIVKVKLISIGSSYVGITDIKIDYKYGTILQHFIDHGSVQLITPSTSISETLDILYQESFETVDFEMKISTTLITGTVNDYGTSDWYLFLTVNPWSSSGLIYVYIFVPIGVVAIAGGITFYFLIKKRKIASK